MGIPGLTQRARRFRTKHKLEHFGGGVFVVDGLNFAANLAIEGSSLACREAASSHWDLYTKACQKRLQQLVDLNPRRVIIVLDAYVDPDKFSVRLERACQRMRGMYLPSIFACFAACVRSFANMKLVYAGAEAEDYIMQLVDECTSARKMFVFSSDSDMYRYFVRNRKLVEIVPLEYGPCAQRIETLRLTDALRVTNSSWWIRPPVSVDGTTYTDTGIYARQAYELANCYRCFNDVYICIEPIPLSMLEPTDYSISECGVQLRRAAYGMLPTSLLRGAHIPVVTEWRQVHDQMLPSEVEPMRDEELATFCAELQGSTATAIFDKLYTAFADAHGLQPEDTRRVCLYIRSLSRGAACRTRVSTGCSRKAVNLHFSLTRSFLDSLELFSMLQPCECERIRLEFDVGQLAHFILAPQECLLIRDGDVDRARPGANAGAYGNNADELIERLDQLDLDRL